MTHAKRNSGKAALAAASVALVFVSACSQAPKRNAAPGSGYKIGAVGAQLSASAGHPGELAQWQDRMARDMQAGRKAAAAKPRQSRSARNDGAPSPRMATGPETSGGSVQKLPSSPNGASLAAVQPAVAPAPAMAAATAAPSAGPAEAPIRLDRVALGGVRALPLAVQNLAETAARAAPWAWLLPILAGFAAALGLAWVLRPRNGPTASGQGYPAPMPANDLEEPRRPSRRPSPAPPQVTILAKAGRR